MLVPDRLDVEADGRNRGHDLAKLELVEDRSFAGGVEAHHDDANFLLSAETTGPHAGEEVGDELEDWLLAVRLLVRDAAVLGCVAPDELHLIRVSVEDAQAAALVARTSEERS